jgi:cytochrome d ubiquinol oxidase subunit I
MPAAEKIERGKVARKLLLEYREARENGNIEETEALKKNFESSDFQEEYFRYFGYSYLNKPSDILPNVPLIFYSFHLMVGLGFLFILLQVLAWWFTARGTMEKRRLFQWILLFSLPLPYLASVLGWLVTEMGRQPWIIQDLMPVGIAVSNLSTSTVQTTFWLFAALFTALLIAEISIMTRQIKIGPKIEEE